MVSINSAASGQRQRQPDMDADTEREALRQRAAARPGFYSPWLHLFVPSAVGLGVVIACALGLHALGPVDLAFAAGVFLLSNIVEWHAHRDLLHKRFAPL